ncbi:ABC nitrate/sulfonate/bicarbonate family transporter, inner membrane subunit [Paraburkholderia xenovorans LB400]|uniref:ABC nitrate/sulfonate/bicarbonate family transporter, inner membrane subunit n=2 Tax=Paraburkholderia xenovorans TaxID=36873 RepID=Q13GI6_PARXL|nr:ABC nitrate/sulfonate/bicarbonate family transporter, inner membrane subunit [Paraburkholderia xenovorans LB400]
MPIVRRIVPSVLFFAVLIVVWEGMARSLHSPLVPDVRAIYAQLLEIVETGAALVQIWVTFSRMALGFLLALVVALPIGIATARSKAISRFVEPGITLGLTVPGLVWALLCVIWFGTSLLSPVISVALGVLPSLVISVQEGIRSLSGELVEMTQVFRLKRITVLRKIWLPVLYAFIVPGTRVGFSIAWKVIVLVEIFGMSDGVGYQLNAQFSTQNVEGVIAWTVAFWATMLVVENLIFAPIERHANRWKKGLSHEQ